MTSVRVRFAPSPTGYLHVGGARTALYNWLFAKKTGGVFVLRIEDTDQARSTEAHTQVILDGLTWLGVTWDEGPFFQGAEVARHQADAERLLGEGKAYRCFCTKAELEAARASAPGGSDTFKYDRRCHGLSGSEVSRRLDAGTPFVIRFLMPPSEISWDDAVHGPITFHGRDLDDLVILRSNRTPIYNLAVVSDDIAMGITHVIRGDDHISNTPKQIALYQALGAPVPVFGHLPMILGPDGKKLSKRHGATAVGDYQHQGILPPAMRNFLALVGWSPGEDREIMTEAEMIAAAKAANAHDFISALPEGYDTYLGERGVRLSGGQRQRIAIARAILKDAPILILDEATSALDAETEAKIKRALDTLRQDRTTFIIAHRLSTVADADKILVLDQGRIIERGNFRSLVAAGGLFARLVAEGGFTEPKPTEDKTGAAPHTTASGA